MVSQTFVFLALVEMSIFLFKFGTSKQDDVETKWSDFKNKFNKKYASQKLHDYRRQVFAANLVRIAAAQNKAKAQNSNRFLGNEHHFLAPSTNAQERSQNQRVFRREAKLNLKVKRQANTVAYTTFDYNAYGVVTPVKDQGVCGGTHAFVFTGLMESAVLRKYGINTNLSEQVILDCVGTYNQGNWDNAGCSGGNLWSESNGVVNSTVYPYTQAAFVNGTNGTCNWSWVNNTSVRQYHPTGWAVWTPAYGGYTSGTLPYNATTDQRLVFNLQTIGPLSQPIYVTWDFQYYLDGIWNPTDQDCIGNVGLHAMIITGYGYGNESSNLYYTDNTTTQNFWISKNSFGTGWGINGYMYVIKDSPNLCTQNFNSSSTFDYIGVAANFTGN
uniref:Peptidase C1A papain C-terminal domain-containing protein n=1 Tax=Acrobeloides nanus TaxID=290746 RepID=A0A914D7N3_9BILA